MPEVSAGAQHCPANTKYVYGSDVENGKRGKRRGCGIIFQKTFPKPVQNRGGFGYI